MSRIIRKQSRNIPRQRRNEGPEKLSQAADEKLKAHAPEIVTALYDAAMKHDAAAAGLLMGLAECAEYAENALARHTSSILEKWAHEPQVVALDTEARLGAGAERLLLTDGSGGEQRTGDAPSPAASEEILDAEVG